MQDQQNGRFAVLLPCPLAFSLSCSWREDSINSDTVQEVIDPNAGRGGTHSDRGGLPVALMAVNGGVRVIMSAVLVALLPLLAIAVLMCVNLARSLQADDAATGRDYL